jgi:glycosyltransferase involved in cell wall biosynthesis
MIRPTASSDAEPRDGGLAAHPSRRSLPPIEIALLTGGVDKPYAIGLASELAFKGVNVDIIGSDEVDSPELHTTPRLNFINLRGIQRRSGSMRVKAIRLLIYYIRLIRYASVARAPIFHILWNSRLEYFDRTFLLLYFKLLGKKVAFTAHNINAGKRDGNDSLINRLTLRFQYRLVDHIFVHTERMKSELVWEFGASAESITVLSFPVNNVIPDTSLTPTQARVELGIGVNEKTILFFGRICPYKGIEYLLEAFQELAG